MDVGEARAIYALFSGGHDSLCATALTAKHPLFRGVVHLNTGIGIEETRQFVRDTCAAQNWPLTEIFAPAGQYEQMVLARGGFPYGVASHNSMLWHLKQKPLDRWFLEEIERYPTGSRLGLVTGIRRKESVRRMGAGISVPVRRKRRKLWLSPLLEWTKIDCNAFMEAERLPRNPVVDLLHRSGECLCGALARQDEFQEIARWFPDVATRIRDLERECEQRGIVACVWAGSEARRLHPDQLQMFAKVDLAPLCTSCESNTGA